MLRDTFKKSPALSIAAAGILILGTGLAVGYGTGRSANTVPIPTLSLDAGAIPYQFLKPLLGVQFQKSLGEKHFAPLLTKIRSVAAAQPPSTLTRYSYYFKDLDGGLWTGINEADQYDPGSMLKVVFAMAAYDQNQTTPGFLSRELTYTPSVAAIQYSFASALPTDLKVGQSYSVPYLIQDMLSDSDNGAKDLLVTSITPSLITKIFTDLSIQMPISSNASGFTISAQEYSRFLRILYYGTYDFSWQDSNLLLGLLNQSTFTDGIVAGVPNGTAVAHKYGEQIAMENGKAVGIELSDCGIVYHPTHPYLICLMTEGTNTSQLASFIAAVSKATYDEANTDTYN